MRRVAGFWLALVLSMGTASAQEEDRSKPIPPLRELEAAGAVIGEIRIDNQNIFDLDDPKEDNTLFRLANKLHIRTRPDTIRRALLFNSGEPLSVRLIEETERLLRSNHYIYDVRIRPVAFHDGIVDIEVMTRDTWTINLGIKFSRGGGSNTTGLGLSDQNFLGTGIAVGVDKTSDVDRTGREFFISRNNAFDGWTTVEYRHANFDDGTANTFKLDRPFYALDTRWAAGISAKTNSRIDSIYDSSNIIGQYRHNFDSADVYGGWSRGLVDGWTQRYSAGIQYQNDTYSIDPALPPPPSGQLPPDLKQVGPFLRYEALQDDYLKVKNRNLIERTEYFALGFRSLLQLGRAMTSLGSTRDLWNYNAEVSDGMTFAKSHNLLLSAYARGQYGSDGGERQFSGVKANYYQPQGGKWNGLLFASAAFDTVNNGNDADQLYLGGDNGLRGYPLRYQTGTNRALFSVEQRAYTDWFPFRLFRVGGAVFFDYGRAWGGVNQNPANPGWLSDVGFGLRILNDRSATGRVTHIDLAFPLQSDPAIKSWQFLVKTHLSF